MFTLPLNKQTFKKDFMDGKGRLELKLGDGQLDLDQPFPAGMSSLVTVSGSANSALEFGLPGDVSCKVNLSGSAKNGIELVWPEGVSKFLEDHALPAIPQGRVGARLYFEAAAGADAQAKMPLGPANFNFGVSAGGGVGYERFVLYDAGTTSRGLLTDLVTGLRLPHFCGVLDKIPEAGELLTFDYNGFLSLNSGLNWGYQLSGSRGIDFRQLRAAVEYDLRMKAGVSFGYRLGGEYSIEARRGQGANFIRLTVRKKRDSKFDAAASFDLVAKAEPKDLPSSADEFLVAVLGADARSGLDLFRKIRKYSNLKTLENEAGKLLTSSLQNLSHQWLGKALDQSSVARFVSIVDRVVSEYDSLEQTVQNQLARIIHIYEDYLGQARLDVLEKALEKVAGLQTRQGMANLSDSEAWAVINQLVGGELFRLMQENQIFADVTGTAGKALDFMRGGFMPEIRDLVHELKISFGLDKVFGTLEDFTSKEKILALADEKLQGVVEKLLGMAWEKINNSNIADAAAKLKEALDKAENFKNVWYKRIVEGINQSFAVQLNYAYTRARHDQSLIDVEIDLSSERGCRLYETAVHGDFSSLFTQENLPLLVVHHGELTHSISKSSQINISVFGWESKHLVEVMAETENLIQTGPTGDIQVFATEVAVKERREKKGRDRTTETVQSNFLMRFSGEAFLPTNSAERPFLIRAVNNMGAEYDLMLTDDRTTVEEMSDYLALAEMVGLVPSAKDFASQLKSEFPNGLGKVTARYVAAFDNDGVRNAFTAPSESITRIAHDVTRSLVRAQIVTGRPITRDLTLIGLVYLNPAVTNLYETEGYTAVRDRTWTMKTGDGVQRTLRRELNLFVVSLLDMEYKVARRLAKLDDVVDRAMKAGSAVPEKELEDAAREFVESAADLNDATPGSNRINNFFAVFDAIARAGSSGKGYRESSMILEIQPEQGSKITKYLAAGPLAQAKSIPTQTMASVAANG